MTPKEQAAMQQAFETWWEREGQEFLYALNTTTDDDIKLVAEFAWKNGAYKVEQPVSRQLLPNDGNSEPVAWMSPNKERLEFSRKDTVYGSHTIPLYTAPQPDMNLNCKSVQKRLATSWGYVLPLSQEYQDHLVNQTFDWSAMAAKHQFMEGYRIGLAEMREKCAKVVTEHAPTCSPHWVSYVVAIRAIKFEGDTGFRPVSEMIAEHKQDPKKAAAIEKAKMRKAEQEPVAVVEITYGREPECYVTGNIDDFPEGVFKLYTHPVRTKDLTNSEKLYILGSHIDPITKDVMGLSLIDAAIAADREKNK